MPKKLTKNSSVSMSSTTTSWANRKKLLPKNWCQQISDSLSLKGLRIKPEQVSDVRMGKIKNIDMQMAVWAEIRKLERKELLRRKKLDSIKNS